MPMNAPTVVVLLVVATLFVLAVRSIVKKRRGGGCAGCSEDSCSGHAAGDACPSALRALADVEARLGSADGKAKG